MDNHANRRRLMQGIKGALIGMTGRLVVVVEVRG
jgi:hypothetical protein